jgi:hypothetical protein
MCGQISEPLIQTIKVVAENSVNIANPIATGYYTSQTSQPSTTEASNGGRH